MSPVHRGGGLPLGQLQLRATKRFHLKWGRQGDKDELNERLVYVSISEMAKRPHIARHPTLQLVDCKVKSLALSWEPTVTRDHAAWLLGRRLVVFSC